MVDIENACEQQVLLDAKTDIDRIRLAIKALKAKEVFWVKLDKGIQPNFVRSETLSCRGQLCGFKDTVHQCRALRMLFEVSMYRYVYKLRLCKEIKAELKKADFVDGLSEFELKIELVGTHQQFGAERRKLNALFQLAASEIGDPKSAGQP
jgi:hypothetical protein